VCVCIKNPTEEIIKKKKKGINENKETKLGSGLGVESTCVLGFVKEQPKLWYRPNYISKMLPNDTSFKFYMHVVFDFLF